LFGKPIITVGTGEKDIFGMEAFGETVTLAVGFAVGLPVGLTVGLVGGKEAEALGRLPVEAVAVGVGLVLPGLGTKESSQPVAVPASSMRRTAAGFLRREIECCNI
jgi:hypothetical protein